MESSENEIYFNFSYYALNLLGKQMYTNSWSAISELVANGLDAGAKNIKIYINSVDKKKSTVEIIDDGSGMSYSDLLNKYVLIGRNKREEEAFLSDRIKGRKGVGKLAGLYLSKKYYIISKKENQENAWILDSTNVRDSEIPKLEKAEECIDIENVEIWNGIQSGTLIRLIDVDMSNFAEKKLEGLKQSIADYYLLDNLNANIKIAYITNVNEKIEYTAIKKEIAFHNFYSFFETADGLKSNELNEYIPVKLTRKSSLSLNGNEIDEISSKDRKVIRITPKKFSPEIKITGEKEFIGLNGEYIKRPYELNGWIGIHSTIDIEEAKKNDERFVKNSAFNPNRLKIYIRDKLAIYNYLEILKNNQAFSNYIEGEISFDILDDDLLPDITSTNREGVSSKDERIVLLTELLKPIVGKLIRDRVAISDKLKKEADEISDQRLTKEKLEKELEEKAKEEAIRLKELEKELKEKAEKKSNELNIKNDDLKKKNSSLMIQNDVKDALLLEADTEKQKLLVHELTMISNGMNSIIRKLAEEFQDTEKKEIIFKNLKHLKRYSDKLSTIKQQFLRLSDYEIGKKNIDIKRFVQRYLETFEQLQTRIKFTDIQFISKVDLFEFGMLLDNIFSNAIERNANKIDVFFDDNLKELKIISNTGPIEIQPIEKIFDLGITTKKNGTGIGMFLVREICDDFGWDILVESNNIDVIFTIKMGDN